MERDDYPFSTPPPGLDDAKEAFRKYKNVVRAAVIIVLVLIFGYLSYFEVRQEEVGVVTRFGKFDRFADPGANFVIPIVEHCDKVPVKRQLKLEFGFRTEAAGVKSAFRRDAYTLKESLMLTGDLNVAVVEWIVHYQIADARQYLFKVRNVDQNKEDNTLRALAEATVRAVVGDYSVTEVLTSGREEILEKARVQLADLCQRYETGVTIQRVELKDSAPPDPVKPSFNEVNQAEQERDRLQNDAWAQYNKEIPKARGQADQIIQQAEGYAIERVNNARGEVERFLALQKEYAAAPRVTRTRIYLETLSEVLPKAGRKLYVDEGAKGVVPLLFPFGQAKGGVQ